MTGIVTLYATFGSEEEAARISRAVVEERLVACANLLGPIRSIYRWQGAVEEAGEVAVLFKTTEDVADRAAARLAELHGYDVPAVVAWPVADGHQPYLDWVRENVG